MTGLAYATGYVITRVPAEDTAADAANRAECARRAELAAEQMEIAYAQVFNPPPADPYVWHDVAGMIDYGI